MYCSHWLPKHMQQDSMPASNNFLAEMDWEPLRFLFAVRYAQKQHVAIPTQPESGPQF